MAKTTGHADPIGSDEVGAIDAQYAIDHGDSVFAPKFKGFLKRCCEIGSRRRDLADSTIKAYARTLERDLHELLKLKPPNDEGRSRDAIFETP